MASAIDPSKPIVGTPTTASVRDNFAAAKAEIEALQGQLSALIDSFANPAIITAEFPPGVENAAPAPGSWEHRVLNTVRNDGGFLVALADNEFTLPAGKYLITGHFFSGRVEQMLLRLHDVTNDTTLEEGINEFSLNDTGFYTTSHMDAAITLAAETALAFQQRYAASTVVNTWGVKNGYSSAERYARVVIRKLPQ